MCQAGNEGGEVRPEAKHRSHPPFQRFGGKETGLPLGASRQLTVFIF